MVVGGTGVKIFGVNEVVKALTKYNRDLNNANNFAVGRAALLYESEVKQSISGRSSEKRSVDTGRFLSSVTSSKMNASSWRVASDVEYANYLEYGSRTTGPARNHFRNSIKRARPKINKLFAEALKKAGIKFNKAGLSSFKLIKSF